MLFDSLPITLLILALYYACLWYFPKYRFRARGLSLPPGPKGILVLGNLRQLPRLEPWVTYTAWAKSYGPVIQFRVFNARTILLSTAKAASDLLENRSGIYSDRPIAWMGGELGGRNRTVFLSSSTDPRFKVFRRLLQTGLNPRASKTYRPIQMEETQVLLKGLATAPDKFQAHIRRNAVAVILRVAYGYQVDGIDDPLVRIIEEGFGIQADLFIPGKYLVEFLPFLRFIPDWCPGAGFKRIAKHAKKQMSRMELVPFQWAKKEIATGNYIESFTSMHFQGDMDLDVEDNLKWCSAALYVGGGDTTVSAMITFFMVMTLHSEIQRKAQQEVDQVACDRHPTLDDYESMPFVRAVIKEILRWGPVVPLGIPHRVTEDDVYENLFIPKGTRIVANIWAITHDEEIYPDPFTFDPTRYLGGSPQPDPFNFAFGFGRRVCPGAHLAEMSLFQNITNIIAVFDISKPLDADGVEIEPDVEWTTGVTSHLKPFDCQIRPRSNEHLLLIN